MTDELKQAIDTVKSYLDMDSDVDSEYLNAQRTIINALEAPPTEVINKIPEDYVYDTETDEFEVYRHKYTGKEIHITKEPKLYKIEAQPTDAVSRQDVDAYIAKLMSGYLYDEERTRLEEFSAYLWELPSVTPRTNLAETSQDCISRDDAVELIASADETDGTIPVFSGKQVIEILKGLPPVTPQASEEDIHREREQAYMLGYEDASKKFRTEPCEDCISRQAVIVGLANIAKAKAKSDAQKSMMGRCMFFVEQLPSVTPQSKMGRWRHYEGMLICSECKAEFYDDIMEYCGDDIPKCCPNCGADMSGGREEG